MMYGESEAGVFLIWSETLGIKYVASFVRKGLNTSREHSHLGQ